MPNNKRRNRASNPNASRTVTRNFVAKNQWQRGGVHEKTTKAKRKNAKQALQRKIRVGKSDSDFLYKSYSYFYITICYTAPLLMTGFQKKE